VHRPTVPTVATYRIQLTPTFGFADTIDLLDHLASLGVSHLYLSPIAEAVPGSLHGYDVIDHTRVRSEFGGEDGLAALLDAADGRDLGVVIDHVPNHMSVAEAHLNDRWWEMLRDGPSSDAARWFDVDWDAADGRVIVPKLGDPLGDVLGAGGLSIAEGDRGPELRYGPLRFPLAPGTEGLDVADAVERQHYRLQWWRDPARNVRRFFTIDDLVAVRAEEPDVAATIDTLPVRLTEHPAFAGVRVDHVDGLAQPEAYLDGLRDRIGDHRWLLVEKILAPGEMLPPSWPVDGTTGYEHVRVTEHTMLDPTAEQPLTDLWTELTGDGRSFAEIEDTARREVLDGGLRPDLDRLVRLIRAGDSSWPVDALRAAIVELTLGVHRYRTYLPDDAASVAELDAAHERAAGSRPDLADDLARLVQLVRGDATVAERWQQLTSPVMAKGAEDRAFYRYLRLAALCEVGGAPGTFTLPIDEFHEHQRQVQATTPTTMLAGTTHDTKRSEGVRARALALAEIADDWAGSVRAWFAEHDDLLRDGLDAATVLLALETAVTAWPIEADRLNEYLVKSTREADEHTSWTEPDEAYEAALARLAEVIAGELAVDLDGEHLTSSGRAVAEIIQRTLHPGWARSLGGLLVRLTAPGVPDLYQGTVAFTYSLVDPDNRVEPDWEERRSLVVQAGSLDGPAAWSGDEIEAAKAVVITRTLALRRRRAEVFGPEASYLALETTGAHADRVLAFARGDTSGARVVTIVALHDPTDWSDTAVVLPEGWWRSVLDDDVSVVEGGVAVDVASWLGRFPVALLDVVAD
jgi:(1->4)-alpha-D-glucan 1-alpha-D-glucosylmutase